jgi:hypothetical protein
MTLFTIFLRPATFCFHFLGVNTLSCGRVEI